MERIHRAQLAQIEIDWGSLPVYETYPAKIPELWAGRPVILFGRYEAGGESWVKVKGLVEGQPAEFPLYVRLPDEEQDHDVLAKVWARKKIADLMIQNYMGDAAVEGEITDIEPVYVIRGGGRIGSGRARGAGQSSAAGPGGGPVAGGDEFRRVLRNRRGRLVLQRGGGSVFGCGQSVG
jgi:hypothetical protein